MLEGNKVPPILEDRTWRLSYTSSSQSSCYPVLVPDALGFVRIYFLPSSPDECQNACERRLGLRRICNSVNLALAVPPPILSRPLDLFIVAGQGRNVLSQQQATLLGLSAAPRFNTLRPSLIGRLILLVLSPTAVYILSYLPISPTQPLSSHSTTRRR
ncbi:hypothetical protein CGMCC3_g7746 [Colletotrichum fructicola]|nr:uncharacterized protein CGMCC3_g7746 [Colletotrichum fructicola]KAE9576237.1 hypothetical protein CGMCC3_g7746 [Colletotrichum fructicola]